MSAGVTHEATGVSHEATGRAWQRGRALTSRTQMLGTKNSRNRFRFFIASWRLRDLTWGQNDESRTRFSITRFLLEQALDSSCKISCLRLLSQTICHRVIVSRFREYWKSRNRKVANSSPYGFNSGHFGQLFRKAVQALAHGLIRVDYDILVLRELNVKGTITC